MNAYYVSRRRRRFKQLPKLARDFLKQQPSERKERAVWRFHRWLVQHSLVLTTLKPAQLRRYRAHLIAAKNKNETRTRNSYDLDAYLLWLTQRGALPFSYQSERHLAYPLSPLAQRYLDTLRPVLRPSTCRTYATSLRRLHRWLEENALSVRTLKRDHMTAWFAHLLDLGLVPSSRFASLITVRSYLRWAATQIPLHTSPEQLIRPEDLPKLPDYLPRPLPPDIDQRLQQRLAAANDPLACGLLLMRHTGIRIGELTALPYDCVRTDLANNQFLKVPLGKLNNERLVPLRQSALKLIESLQADRPASQTFLLQQPSGRSYGQAKLRSTLADAARPLTTTKPITSHRLRHTYATSLLSGGMSLVGLMHLLGHRTITMTLRYAQVTPTTLVNEYQRALEKLKNTYPCLSSPDTSDSESFDPEKAMDLLIHWLRYQPYNAPRQAQLARTLGRRLQRISAHLPALRAP